MKKVLFILLCVCACMAATATIPLIDKANFHTALSKKLTKQNKLSELTKTTLRPDGTTYKQFMDGAKKSLQNQKVGRDNLVNKRAPRRLSDDEIINNPYVCFLYAYEYDYENGDMFPSDPFYASGGAYWYPDTSDGLYFAGLYWDIKGSTYYLPIDVDYSTGEVALSWGFLLEDDTTTSGTGRNYNDTIRWAGLFSKAYFEYGEQTDCMGTLYGDGSIIFDDGYVYYCEEVINAYRNRVLYSSDTTIYTTIYEGTEILAANGVLSYNQEKDGRAAESPVYMFQEGDDLYVGNMWNYGVPSCKMTLTTDNKALYECAEFDPTDSITYLSNPIWDVDDSWISGGLGMFYPIGSYELDEDGYLVDYTWGFEADATPEQITWPYTMPGNGYHFLYGFENNVLRYTNGQEFIIPTNYLRGDVNNDGEIDIHDIITLIDHLRSEVFDDTDDFISDAADCNQNGSIDWNDIDALYNYIETGSWPEP